MFLGNGGLGGCSGGSGGKTCMGGFLCSSAIVFLTVFLMQSSCLWRFEFINSSWLCTELLKSAILRSNLSDCLQKESKHYKYLVWHQLWSNNIRYLDFCLKLTRFFLFLKWREAVLTKIGPISTNNEVQNKKLSKNIIWHSWVLKEEGTGGGESKITEKLLTYLMDGPMYRLGDYSYITYALQLKMDYVRDGEIQGRSLVFL